MRCEYMNVHTKNNPNTRGPRSMQNKQRAQLNKWERDEEPAAAAWALCRSDDSICSHAAHKHVN
jgi:hypothetical protein